MFVWTGALQGEKIIQEALDARPADLYLKSGDINNLMNIIREIHNFVTQRRPKDRAA
jgi:hypothetical protein